ncbi:putative kinase [Streptosporangium jomthongense]|uniref:Type II toxin-antitoxin system HipA family toxin n=1 Tax=Marinobacter aromaticivorans TaxID=1494078 RepID=A0ABW2IS14_9GAMM|nr:HipA domain-containing protein [Marinobacter aromaticivorans]GGE57709.1 putative kinase [Streptosporangium jomthongense]
MGYHSKCLDYLLGSKVLDLNLPESRKDLVSAIPKKTHGFSISGVQMKCQMAIEDKKLKLVDSGGQFIMKPSPEEYQNVAENEHATLVIMDRIGFEVPPCGLLRLQDDHLVFLIRRYDRNFTDGSRLHQEDAMQALGIANTESSRKYTSASYQEVMELIIEHAGMAVAMELLLRLVFSYVVGNDDHHLKNISFYHEPMFRLTPCYDVLASSLYSSQAENPMALPFLKEGEPQYYHEMGNGYYAGSDFVELGKKAGLLEPAVRKRIIQLLKQIESHAPDTIRASFMPDEMKTRYLNLISQRMKFMKLIEPEDK